MHQGRGGSDCCEHFFVMRRDKIQFSSCQQAIVASGQISGVHGVSGFHGGLFKRISLMQLVQGKIMQHTPHLLVNQRAQRKERGKNRKGLNPQCCIIIAFVFIIIVVFYIICGSPNIKRFSII
jgi:hypothetical protein